VHIYEDEAPKDRKENVSAISWPEQANVQCDDGEVGFVLDQKA
jgi:hypothetical protein